MAQYQGPPGDGAGCSWMSSLDFLGAEDLMGALGAPGDMAFLDSATLAAVCSVGQHQHQQPNQHQPSQLASTAEVVVKRPNPDDDCGGDDSDDEDARARSGSNKRSKGDSSADAARTKASKEKARRGKINDRFSELAKLIEPPGSEPKTDKPSILGDAIKFVQQMTVENHQLKQLNKFLEERVAHYERERGQNLYQQSLVIQGMRPQQQQPAPQHQPMHMQHQPMHMQAMQQHQQPVMMQAPAMMHQVQQQQQQGPMMQQAALMQVVQQQQQQQGSMMQQAGASHVHMSGLSHAGSEPLEPATSTHSAGQLPSASVPQHQQQPQQQQQQQQQQQHALVSAASLHDCQPPSDGMPPNSLPPAPAPTSITTCPPHYSMLPMHGGAQQYTVLHLPPGQHHYYSTDLKGSMGGGQVAAMQAPMQAMQPMHGMGMPHMGPGAKPPHWVTNMLDSTQDSLLRPPAA